ncbi:Formate hydrogenlyase subunit 4 [Chryseolinea serpens]|uniref:Formate hydrogenlyase subunit 4 n=2 Tax=Chryseolinea serpens TaxID=947013 RepID=A0A1M5VBV7_9BACT|nr:Formate hydrogenlyase subunit 4 [Chryseolinea serpens]
MLSLGLIIMASLFFGGIILRTKSLASGRKGPGVFQPLKDVIRLLKKGAVYSRTTSFIFQVAPTVYFGSIVMAVLLIPFGESNSLLSFKGDFILFAYVLAIGKFFMIISSLDTGSAFEGMGASREALYSLLVEPAFFLILGSFALLTGHTSFHEIFASLHLSSAFSYALATLATFVFVLIAMIENSRLPIDDPKTHLELTMIHEVMILDNSGYDLGLILYATNLKFAMYGALVTNFFIAGMSLPVAILLFIVIQVAFAATAGLIESFLARFRMNHNAQFIFSLSSISLVIFFGVLLILGKFS